MTNEEQIERLRPKEIELVSRMMNAEEGIERSLKRMAETDSTIRLTTLANRYMAYSLERDKMLQEIDRLRQTILMLL